MYIHTYIRIYIHIYHVRTYVHTYIRNYPYVCTMYFIEIPAVDDLNVVDKCDNVVATWKRIVGPCKNSSYNVTLLSSNGSTIDYKITNEASYTFNDTTELSSAISVSVTTVNKGYNGTARVATANNGKYTIIKYVC